jgi:hypothetical protein
MFNEEDGRALVRWYEGLALQDVRYNSKALLEIAHRAMLDEEFRRRLLDDTQAVLLEIQKKLGDFPKGFTLKFLENTKETVNVVLPHRAGEATYRPTPLRDLLHSRTSEQEPGHIQWFHDDWSDNDPNDRDPPITLPVPEPGLPDGGGGPPGGPI